MKEGNGETIGTRPKPDPGKNTELTVKSPIRGVTMCYGRVSTGTEEN